MNSSKFPRLLSRLASCLLFAVFFLALAFAWALPHVRVQAAEPDIVVFAAASATNALTDIGNLYTEKGFGGIKCSFASSSTLAKQIEQGAPADVFLSANLEWMDYLEQKNLLAPGSRKGLLGNSLALIVPENSPVQSFEIKEGADLAAILGQDGRLAVGDPAHVPVGIYGKQALENLNLWDAVQDRLAPAKDVRASLVMVARGEAPLGLIYASDVSASDKVRIIGLFPESSHPAIIYSVGVVNIDQVAKAEAAGEFIDFLFTPEAKAIFKKYGFDVL
ncbi:MAG: molybdate ABC transporter substrate-binding protein [Deltaproteobacteria bacterium]|jgi:molybdate transport system substrate-binding protein|nr:molybdate ABC transporter substrate-binding protein [Deltaproteobacteria bacterium]